MIYTIHLYSYYCKLFFWENLGLPRRRTGGLPGSQTPWVMGMDLFFDLVTALTKTGFRVPTLLLRGLE
jgi:hypothetical protein